MKVSFPLSLKVTLWLLLNLLLLAAAASGFLVAQGGLSWDSLVAGAAGNRLHALANVIVGEVAATSRDQRDAVLARIGAAYGADFVLVRNHGPVIAGGPAELPPLVRQRVDEGPPSDGRGPPGFGPPGDEDGPPPGRGLGPPEQAKAGRPPGPVARGRFVVHTGSPPAAWWIGLRVPFNDGNGRPLPATLVVQAHSFGRVIRLLNLETWLLVGGAVVLLSVLFWLPLVRSITHHLRAMTAATECIADGKFETRVATNRRDELGRLGASVNAMAARLDTLVNGQKRFLGDVAHELGSPLGRLQVATEILESRADPALREHVADVREEVQHMAELVGELLAFTKAGMRPRDALLVPVAIEDVFAKVLAREDLENRVNREATSELRVLADGPLLIRAVGNLVRNALRYASEGGPIRLIAMRDGEKVVIAVEDHGPGVPGAALARLGEPFFRPELARTRETGGVGLGLAIVRSGIAACGGEVRFSNRTPRGFRAEIRLAAA
jgi:two-component system, OmpR family, sensor histidine kinase CpxA